jgi:hypothetical protein
VTILTALDYPAIRAALDVGLNAQQLPDATIAQGIFLGAAEDELLRKVPGAATMTGDDLARVKRALVWLTAAYLAHSVVRLTSISIQTRDLSYSRQTFDPDAKAAELRARAGVEIAALVTPSAVAPARPTMFTLAGGGRGR